MTSFAPAERAPPLGRDDIHVWFFPEWDVGGRSAESAIVRSLLAEYAGEKIVIDYDARGKAHIRGGALHFNVSHSGGALALAVSGSQPLGIDLEHRRRPRRAIELAHRFFAPHEAAALEKLPESQQEDFFLRLWTHKEALVKAEGSGIAGGLHRAVFDVDDRGAVMAPRDRSWQVIPFEPLAGFVGAVAWRGAPRQVSYLVRRIVR